MKENILAILEEHLGAGINYNTAISDAGQRILYYLGSAWLRNPRRVRGE